MGAPWPQKPDEFCSRLSEVWVRLTPDEVTPQRFHKRLEEGAYSRALGERLQKVVQDSHLHQVANSVV